MARLFRLIASIVIISLLLAGCANAAPKLVSGVTPPPAVQTAAPVQTEAVETASPEPETPAPSGTPEAEVDALGNGIYLAEHYTRYIAFEDILIYENDGDTFIDCKAENSYPVPILCAVNIEFSDDGGRTIATSSLQMANGSFLLVLKPGTNLLYARILTDIRLTDKQFTLLFDPETPVRPE